MEKKYYEEEVVKFSHWREEYLQGLYDFLITQKERAKGVREQFITPQKYKDNPKKYRECLMNLLGFPLNQNRANPKLHKKEFIATDGNVNIYRMQLTFFDGLRFYGLYFEQIENAKEAPFVIGLHGGGDTPEIVSSMYDDSGCYHHLVRRITDKGANVFAPQLLLWRDEPYGANYDRVLLDGKLRQLGGSITALEIYMLQGCIDYFLSEEGVNSEKIGAAGMSYGGMYALLLSAVDVRIKACYSSSWVNDCYIHSWADWSYLNAQNSFTVAEMAAMIAPRALVVAMGDKDTLFDYQITQQECDRIRPYYEIFEKSQSFKCIVFNGLHEVDWSDEEIDFLFKNLVD